MTEIQNHTEELEAMTEIHPTEKEIEDMTQIQYPTEEEMEAMYEDFLKSGSFTEVFDDDPF